MEELSATFENLFNSELLSDCTIVVGRDKTHFKVHSVVLFTRSEVFRRMFLSGMQETKLSIVANETWSVEEFKQFLRFLYSAKVDFLDPSTSPVILYMMANYYMVQSLKDMCLSEINKTINTYGRQYFETAVNFSLDGLAKLLALKLCKYEIMSNKILEWNYEYLLQVFKYGRNVWNEDQELLMNQLLLWSSKNNNNLKSFIPYLFPGNFKPEYLFKTIKPLNIFSAEQLNILLQFQLYPRTTTTIQHNEAILARKSGLSGYVFAGEECKFSIDSNSFIVTPISRQIKQQQQKDSIIFFKRFNSGVHEWIVHIQNNDSLITPRVFVGIAPSSSTTGDIHKSHGYYLYTLPADDSIYTWHECKRMKLFSFGNEVITEIGIQLDMTKKVISFSKNGSERKLAWKNLQDEIYHPTIGFTPQQGLSVRLSGQWVKEEIEQHPVCSADSLEMSRF